MQSPLSRLQKVVAYTALALVLVCTAFGVFVIWLLLTDPTL